MRFATNIFTEKNYLSKDIILLATDGRYGDQGIKSWLDGYHTKTGTMFPHISQPFPDLSRGGSIQAAVHIDIKPTDKLDQLIILSGKKSQQKSNKKLRAIFFSKSTKVKLANFSPFVLTIK